MKIWKTFLEAGENIVDIGIGAITLISVMIIAYLAVKTVIWGLEKIGNFFEKRIKKVELKEDPKSLKEEIKAIHKEFKFIHTRLSRVEGTVYGKDVYKLSPLEEIS